MDFNFTRPLIPIFFSINTPTVLYDLWWVESTVQRFDCKVILGFSAWQWGGRQRVTLAFFKDQLTVLSSMIEVCQQYYKNKER